jgi:hypothetical protein
MPIESFYEMLVIDTPEKAQRILEAFEAADKRGPYVPECDVLKELEEGRRDIEKIIAGIKLARERSNSL